MRGLKSTGLLLAILILNLGIPGLAEEEFVSWCRSQLRNRGEESAALRILQTRFSVSGCGPLYRKMAATEHLWLNSLGLKSIHFLSYFPGTTRLDLTDNYIRDIRALVSLPGLTHLWLGENEIENLTPVSALKSLKLLVLEDNRIQDASPLSGCRNLQALDLGRNQLNSLSFCSRLTELRYVFINRNFIDDISPLAFAGDPLSQLASGKSTGRNFLHTVQIEWSRYAGRSWNIAENFRVYNFDGNPILREFWESGYVQKNSKNCPSDTGFKGFRTLCSGIEVK